MYCTTAIFSLFIMHVVIRQFYVIFIMYSIYAILRSNIPEPLCYFMSFMTFYLLRLRTAFDLFLPCFHMPCICDNICCLGIWGLLLFLFLYFLFVDLIWWTLFHWYLYINVLVVWFLKYVLYIKLYLYMIYLRHWLT